MNELTITLKIKQLSILENIVIENDPVESCAILLGKEINKNYMVSEVISVKNKDISKVKFAVDADILFEIYKHAESKNLSVIGIFHSHPSVPEPSETDKIYMEINPIPWIIKSTISNKMKCYIMENSNDGSKSRIEKVVIKIIKD